MHESQPSWLTIDLDLLTTDTQQLRLHLVWLLEDLRACRDRPDGRASTPVALTDEVEASLTGLADRDDLLARLGR